MYKYSMWSWKMYSCVLVLLLSLICFNSAVSFNKPECHRGIMSLFNWCEQSDCQNNCTCLSKNHVCKQICGQKMCPAIFCSSPTTCFQSVLISEDVLMPKVNKMVSHSPISQQDCTQGKCSLMKALKYKKTYTRTFQSCSEGRCGHVYTTGDHAKQFCGHCDKMTCTGKSATNCTQLCVLGNCKQMTCNAKYCKQLCSHQSGCNMTCGKNAEICDQTCNGNSKCIMNCHGKQCHQSCKDSKNCVKNVFNAATTTTTTPSLPPPPPTTTTETLPTTITTITIKKTIRRTTLHQDKTNQADHIARNSYKLRTVEPLYTKSFVSSTEISNELEMKTLLPNEENKNEVGKITEENYKSSSTLVVTSYTRLLAAAIITSALLLL